MSKKFNKGDTVRRINCEFESNMGIAKIGQEATGVATSRYGGVRVEFKAGERAVSQGWMVENAELVQSPCSGPQAPQPEPGLQWVELHNEAERIYHFPDGSKFIVEDATRLCVRPTSHRLETTSGRKFIIPGKFIAIEIHAKDWSA